MKKRGWMAAALLLVCGILAAGIFLAHGRRVQFSPAQTFTGDRNRMTVSASVTEDLRTVKGSMKLEAVNRTGEALEEIVLRTFADAMQENSLHIGAVRVNGEEAAFDRQEPSVLRVKRAWKPEERVVLECDFALTVRTGEGMLGRTEERAVLLGALPTLAVWEDGGWRTDELDVLAEPSYAEAFDLEVTLTLPEGVQAAFGGAMIADDQNENGTHTQTAQMSGARDVSFLLFAEGKLRQKQVQHVLVSAYDEAGKTASTLVQSAEKALNTLEKIGFAYPFPALTIVRGDMGKEDGLSLSGLAVVSEDVEGKELDRQVMRLTARQIFGISVESDPWKEPWLSQTLASAVELLGYRAEKGDAAFEKRFFSDVEIATRLTRPHGVNVGAGVEAFGDDHEMTQVLRDQGAAGLLGIAKAAGEDNFLRALACYARENAGGFGSVEGLLEALKAETGSSWEGYLFDILKQ